MWVRQSVFPTFSTGKHKRDDLCPQENSGKWRGGICGTGELHGASYLLLPSAHLFSARPHAGPWRQRKESELSHAHWSLDGQGDNRRGHWKSPEESFQEKVRWRDLASPALTP